MSIPGDLQAEFKRDITQDEILYMVNGSLVKLPILEGILQAILPEVLDSVIPDAEMEIKLHTPVRTGQLRDNLLKHLAKSKASGHNLLINIKANPTNRGVHYAGMVNDMDDVKVRHFDEMGSAGYYNTPGRIRLNDPHASGHFFDELTKITNDSTMKAIAKGINRNFKGTGAKRAVGIKLLGGY